MSSPIGPGDWVVCVDASPRREWVEGAGSHYIAALSALRPGAEYRVIAAESWACGASNLVVEGAPGPGLAPDGLQFANGWAACRFRKIDRISDEFRKALLTPVPLDPEPVEEAQRSEPAEPVPTHGTKARSLSQLQQKEA